MKIVIVGGGTAGWIAAYFLAKSQPGKHEIVVVESSKLGIIGAGEGSTGTMLELLNGTYFPYACDINQFLKEVDGTPKMGIYHQNWLGDGEGYFAPIDSSPTWFQYDDYLFKYALAKYGKERMHLASPIGIEFAKENYNVHALHFDGHKVGQFFKKICIQDGVQILDNVVNEITVDNHNNISNLILDNNNVVTGDFFIDCSGFSRILMNKLNVSWDSYAEYLPVNTAMPFILDYTESEHVLPLTTATAMSAGWMWNIPLSTRKGCGYVFDSNFITREQAQEEVELYLGRKIQPIKFINFEAGKSEKFWHKNVLALGLASAFVEPLEATSIHATIIQMLIFSKEFLLDNKESTLSELNENSYNEKMARLYDSILDFVSFHYQGGRNDTEFWKSITEKNKCTPRAKQYLEKCKHKIPGFLEINGIIGSPNAALWNWIAGGIDAITPTQALLDLQNSNKLEIAEHESNSMLTHQQKSYIKYL
jgi:tryptophan halogenase